MTVFLVGINVALVTTTMMITLVTIFKQIIAIKAAIKSKHSSEDVHENNDDIPFSNETLIKELRYSRVQVVQALMYIAAYFLTWVFMIVPMVVRLDPGSLEMISLDVFKIILFPMQGFWNLVIFAYDKVYNIHQVNDSLTHWQAIKSLLLYPEEIPEITLANVPFDSNGFGSESREVMSSPSTIFFERLANDDIGQSCIVENSTSSLESSNTTKV
jgi:hypothetical protein